MRRKHEPLLPTFFVAGAAKAGSTTLYEHLKRHPQIAMSSGKEPNLFAAMWESEGIDGYRRQYAHYAGERHRGEATVEYFVAPEVPERIYRHIPSAKLIFSLRHPIERAISHYWHRVKMRQERRSLQEALRHAHREYFVDASRYGTNLQRFLDYFPREQILVIILERLSASFEATMKEVWSHLEVEHPSDVIDTFPKNVGWIQRNARLWDAMEAVRRRRRVVDAIPFSLRPHIRGLYQRIRRWNQMSHTPPALTRSQRAILEDALASERQRLEQILGFHVAEWGEDETERYGLHG